MNIFKVLSSDRGRITETNISAMLAYLLNPDKDHGIGDCLVKQFVRLLNHEKNDKLLNDYERFYNNYKINVQSEFQVDVKNTESSKNKRFIDILLEFNKADKTEFSICIENKINDASFSDPDQVKDEILGLEKKYGDSPDNSTSIYFILICPEDNQKIVASFDKISGYNKQYILWKNDEESIITIIKMLTNILDDESKGKIDPLSTEINYIIRSFISFINNNFQSDDYQEEIKNERINYGKPIIEYLRQIYDELSFGNEYDVNYIKNSLTEKVKEQSGRILNMNTKNCQFYRVVVNEKMRTNYYIKGPLDEKFNLFYYTDAEKRDFVKKFDFNSNDDIEIFYLEDGDRTCKKLSEIKNDK